MNETDTANGVLCWHFTTLDGTTEWLKGPEEVGRIYRVKGKPRCCANGLHGSERAIDALNYASGPLVRRTLHTGEFDRQSDKLCSTERRVLWEADATRTLHEFACGEAEITLNRERETGHEPDPRSWAAIGAKRKWLRGEISDGELADARADARAAAQAAAQAAAWAAAQAAAQAAAWAAARAAAQAAARGAAQAAARGAARGAIWDESNARLEAALMRLAPTKESEEVTR